MGYRSGPTNFRRKWLSASLLLAAVVTLSCALVSSSFSGLIKSGVPEGLIAYIGADGNIYTIDREGGQPTSITRDASTDVNSGTALRVYQHPTWAPDGRSLAFVSLARSSPADARAIVLTSSPDGKDLTEVFSSQDYFPFYMSWSPDSQHVTFLSNHPGGSGLALTLLNIEDKSSQIIGTGQPYYWDWSPDSSEIIAHSGGPAAFNPLARVSLLKLDDPGQKTDLKLKPGFFQAPAWSPGGEDMLLAVQGEDEEELLLARRDGSIKQVLVELSGPVAFAWSPDGKKLAYTASSVDDLQGLYSNLVLLDPQQPAEQNELASQVFVVAFFWSPDGQKIAYFIPDLEDEGPQGISLNTFQPEQRPSLKLMVYDLMSEETGQAAVFTPTDAFIQILAYFDQYQRSGTIWSPDSQYLVLPAINQEGVAQIVVVHADGSQFRPVAEGDLAFWSWK